MTMSQKIKKKRLKTSQKTANLPVKEDSKIVKYFTDYLSSHHDLKIKNINQLLKISEILLEDDKSRTIFPKTSQNISLTTVAPIINSNKSETTFKENSNIDSQNKNITGLFLTKQTKFLTSFKHNKINLFSNVTDTFSSSKILSFQTLNVNDEKRFELSSWGLPQSILQKYKAHGISTLFPWQVECLANHKILEENKNLIYSAPTSAGKTLVAEFIILKTVLERHKKVIFILPFISVVREKVFYFQDLFSDSGIRVEGFMGGIAPAGGFSAVHVAIATIEKANSLINYLMKDDDLITLGAVVIDELHLLGDPGRGYLLELLLTKLRYMTLSLEHINIQLIGMSATLPNLSLIAEWLDAELYKTDFRPIPLNEQYKINRSIFDCKMNVIRELEAAPDIMNDTDNIIQLCIETISGGHGVLIFCPTKSWCEKLASQIAYKFFQLGSNNSFHGEILRKNINANRIEEILIQLEHCPIGLDHILKKTISFSVAFHHAGLTMDERDIIEGGFRIGSLKVLIATSTLSSGVNLPARRVIIRSPKFHGKPLDKLTYQQMIGRAGRMGKDTAGESILVCQPSEHALALNLMTTSLEPIESCLESSTLLIRALLEAIASEIVRTPEELDFYCKCTFVHKCDKKQVMSMIKQSLQFLIDNEFLLLKESDENKERLVATCLGKACLAASISPKDGLFLFEELQRARKCLVLDTELHVVYLVTPFNSSNQISQVDWTVFLELWKTLSESERRVGKLVGVEERFLMTAMRGIVKHGRMLNIHQRFYTALALYDLVREVSLNTVCRKYNCSRGLLQSLQQSSSTFAGMVTNFCKELKWDCMELLFAQFQVRLQFGVCRDLLDLLRLPSLNGLRARSLFKHGITTVAELAVTNEHYIEEALNKAVPFESEKNFDGEDENEVEKRTKMRTIFITGKDGLTTREAARVIIMEARGLVKNELGVHDVQWTQINNTTETSLHLKNVNPISMRTSSTIDAVRPLQSTTAQMHLIADSSNNKRVNEEPVNIAQSGGICLKKYYLVKKSLSKCSDSLFVSSTDSINDSSKIRISSEVLEFTDDKKTSSYNECGSKYGKRPFTSRGDTTNGNVEPPKCLRLFDATLNEKDNDNPIDAKIVNDKKNVSKIKKDSSIFVKDLINEKNLSKFFDKTNNSSIIKKVYDVQRDSLKLNKNLSISSEDLINKSDGLKTNSKSLRSKLLEKTKSLLNDNNIMIRSTDSQDKIDSTLGKSVKSKIKSQLAESFDVNDPILDEMMQNFEKKQNKDIFDVVLPIINANISKENKRNSADSNYSKSLSIFSDSSFFDPQMCSILEKNVMDSGCCAEFETSKFTPQNQSPKKFESLKKFIQKNSSFDNSIKFEDSKKKFPNESSVDLISNQNNCVDDQRKKISTFNKEQMNKKTIKDIKQISHTSIWIEDSWDKIKNQKIRKNKNKSETIDNEIKEIFESNSPSLLQKTNTHLRRSMSSQKTFSTISRIQVKASKDKSLDVTSMGASKSILRKHFLDNNISENSPIASVRSYNTRRPFTVRTSLHKSESDNSILSSQTPNSHQVNINKTRLQIEQKLGKSLKFMSTNSKFICETPELLNQNTEVSLKNTNTNNNETNGVKNHSVFNSYNTVNLKMKNIKKIHNKTSSGREIKVFNDNYFLNGNNEETNLKMMAPVNVANSRRIFRLFCSEIEDLSKNERKSDLAVALVIEDCANNPAIGIGNRIIGVEEKKKDKKADAYIYKNKKICGIVIFWGTNATYYMSFGNTKDTKTTIKERMSFLRDILLNPLVTLRCFDAKEVYKMLYIRYEIEFRCKFLDPNVGDWMMNSDSYNKNYTELAAHYFPKGLEITNALNNNCKNDFLNKNMRASGKALLVWYVTEEILNFMKAENSSLLPIYKEIEMPVIIILANMELRGIGINTSSLQELSNIIKNDLSLVEEKAFNLAGRKFNFYSSKQVSQVLGINKKGKNSTNKMALRSCENPISNLITLWRKLNTVQTKIIFPLLQCEKKNNRIYGSHITYTVTGRVSMHEPNLQTIPRDFESDISNCILSVRMAFITNDSNVMLSADYCQLELRILAHFSEDPVLCNLMHEEGDIFKNIAARLDKISEDMVNDEQRQRAKQLCYAMIYGIGLKSLSDILGVTESEAKDYLETFMGTYKGIRIWLSTVIEEARIKGFVSTLTNRRRILSGINSKTTAIKSQAERQAVNTKIQGSAADVTKKAMVLIEKKLHDEFFINLSPILLYTQRIRKLRYSDTNSKSRNAYLLLQLHDELLFEVSLSDLPKVASIIKESMEHAYKLRVPIPVKIKVGTAWGNLKEYKF